MIMESFMDLKPLTSAFASPTFGEDSSFHVEQPVGSMSISPCGRDVVLASKEGLHVIDLDSPYSPPRYLPHHTPWEVADVQWSPFAARDYWVVSTSNQKALVWNLAMKAWENSIEHVLHAHTRAITDINFSAHHPDVIATCAVDSFVHCWDLRIPLRPAISFSDWLAGATQVKWNRQDPHVIASSHDKYLRIWDDRMGAYPIRSIEAHSTKIYGVDWNRFRPGALVTCSLDKTVKFWDYTVQGDAPEKLISVPFPVWRARHTPFGWGVLAMPQRGNSDLHLYSRGSGEGINFDESTPLVHSFPGHKGQVKEFLWRTRGDVEDGIDNREFQLVSWGTDKELRLHRVNPDILKAVGYEKGKSFIPTLNITRKGAVYKTFRDENPEPDADDTVSPLSSGLHPPTSDFARGIRRMNTISFPYSRGWTQGGAVGVRAVMQGRSKVRPADSNPITWMRGVKISGWDVETLGDEITHVGEKFRRVVFESVDVQQRTATISLHGPWAEDGSPLFLKVDIKFPTDYPRASVPNFSIQKTTKVTDQFSSKTVSDLRKIARTYVCRKRGCLEGVVRYLLGESSLEETVAWVQGDTAETIKSPINDDESSDEDEVGLSRSQELGMSSELLRPVNANVMVPVPKGCGALWAPNGRLVCFFQPQKDKSATVLDLLGFSEMTKFSREEKIFEGFGRLQTTSPRPRISGTLASTDDGGSDYSDESDAESSSSSGSSDILSALQSRFPAPSTWRNPGSLGFNRTRSTDNSQRSTVGAITVKSAETPQNIVSIRNLDDLLPAKRELATKYRICGNVADVCAHNAAVALDAGCHELAQVWALVKLILQSKSTNVSLPNLKPLDRRSKHRIDRTDCVVDGKHDGQSQVANIMHWGDHPFGGRWLVPAIFDHFERIGDIQMLAMLSCVFYEADSDQMVSHKYHRRERSGTKRIAQRFFQMDYSSSHSTGHSRSQSVTPFNATPKESLATPVTNMSRRPSTEQLRVDPSEAYSMGTTPPLASRPVAGIPTNRKSQSNNVSLAASPEQQNSQSRGGPGLGSALASSLSRSFTFGPSSVSPPTGELANKQRQSGAASLNITVRPAGWVASANEPKQSAASEYRDAFTKPASRAQPETEKKQPQQSERRAAKFTVTFKNQSSFEDNGHGLPFLNPTKQELYISYRAAYADLLSIWGLHIQQSEILKVGFHFPQLVDPPIVRSNRSGSRTSFLLPVTSRVESPEAPVDDNAQSLDIQRHCFSCGHALHLSIFSAESAPKQQIRQTLEPRICPKCNDHRSQPLKLPCTICAEVVQGLLIPCLGCGHVTCFACHQSWFCVEPGNSQANDTVPRHTHRPENDGDAAPRCPTGCGCICSEHMAVAVPMPSPRNSIVSDPRVVPEDATGSHFNLHHPPPRPKNGHNYKPDLAHGLLKSTFRRALTMPTHNTDPASSTSLESWHTSSPFASLARGSGAT